MNKEVLRKKFHAIRKNISQAQLKKKSELICKLIFTSPEFKIAKHILFFASLPFEPNLLPLIEKTLTDKTKNIYLPFTEIQKKNNKIKNTMQAQQIKNLNNLNKKPPLNILEPSQSSTTIPPEKLDLILVPAVCVDYSGNRIGFGKGYYDRFLNQTNAHKMGVIFKSQLLDKIPSQVHDVKMDSVATDNGIRYFLKVL